MNEHIEKLKKRLSFFTRNDQS